MELVDAVERVADSMRQEWGLLITDDAIAFFRENYDHGHVDRQSTLTEADRRAWHRTLDATDGEITAALDDFAARRAGR